jgi:hypothetical protein
MTSFLLPALLTVVLVAPAGAGTRQKHRSKAAPDEMADVSAPVPVVFGKKDDGLPEKLTARGTITKASLSRACGVVFWSGTLEITLRDKIERYPHPKVYVVVNCLEDNDEKKYLGEDVEVGVSKLYPSYSQFHDAATFYFESIDNTIDSGGIPFYCTTMSGDDILKTGSRH